MFIFQQKANMKLKAVNVLIVEPFQRQCGFQMALDIICAMLVA